MDTERAALVAAYWRHHTLTQGARAERLAADEQAWAVEAVHDAIDDDLAGVLDLLGDLLASPQADLVAFGSGPLEDLLATQPQHADAVAVLCRQQPRWREAIGSVQLDEDERDEVDALLDFLPR